MRHAVGELVVQHILVRRQGRGTFVATHTADCYLFQFFRDPGVPELIRCVATPPIIMGCWPA